MPRLKKLSYQKIKNAKWTPKKKEKDMLFSLLRNIGYFDQKSGK